MCVCFAVNLSVPDTWQKKIKKVLKAHVIVYHVDSYSLSHVYTHTDRNRVGDFSSQGKRCWHNRDTVDLCSCNECHYREIRHFSDCCGEIKLDSPSC